jgi:hypothetical protein
MAAERPAYQFEVDVTIPRVRWEAWEMLCLAHGDDPEHVFCALLAELVDRVMDATVGVPPAQEE